MTYVLQEYEGAPGYLVALRFDPRGPIYGQRVWGYGKWRHEGIWTHAGLVTFYVTPSDDPEVADTGCDDTVVEDHEAGTRQRTWVHENKVLYDLVGEDGCFLRRNDEGWSRYTSEDLG